MWQRKRVASSLLGALLVLFVTGGIRAQGNVQLSPDVLTVPFFPGNGQISLSLISGDSDTNRFVFALALVDFVPGLGSSPVYIRSTAASISSATVIDQGDFDTLTTLIQVSDRVDLQVVSTTPSAAAVLEIQFQGTPAQIEFFNNFGNSVTATVTLGFPVDIDIKPGSDSNCVNNNGHGVIPVAILGSETFDVSNVDNSSLMLDGFAVRMKGNKGPLCHFDDSNGDGVTDLVCLFEDSTPDNWTEGTSTATLVGELMNGMPIVGTDSICIVP
jgi:hypothetical protein